MNVFSYLVPDSPLAMAVVVVLVVIFGGWALKGFSHHAELSRARRTLSKLDELVGDLRLLQHSLWSGTGTVDAGLHEHLRDAYRAAVSKMVDEKSPVCRLQEVVFVAGATQSRLESMPLLAEAETALFADERRRRSLIGAFLIIGLLGTLVGLADSIVSLLNLLGSSQSGNQAIIGLLQSLRGAFAPSLWGVGLTLIAIGQSTWYDATAIAPLGSELRQAVLARWIPELYPTSSTLAQDAALESMRAAKEVESFARSIEKDSTGLRDNLSALHANTESTATAMGDLAAKVQTASLDLTSALNHSSERLQSFDEVSRRFESFERTLKPLVDGATDAQRAVQQIADDFKNHAMQESRAVDERISAFEKSYAAALERMTRSMDSLKVPFADVAQRMLDQSAINVGRMEGMQRDFLEHLQRSRDILQALEASIKTREPARPLAMAAKAGGGDPALVERVDKLIAVLEKKNGKRERSLFAFLQRRSRDDAQS